jgi:Domain of unknown function (DUF4124)
MHPWRPWFLLATLAAFAGQAAVVYKWTDSDGVVHYSDQPVPGAQKIYTATSASAGAASGERPNVAPQGSNATRNVASALTYEQFSITSPSANQTFFGEDIVAVHLALDPNLKPEQIITWHLNGKQLDDQGPTATQFALQHLDRGAYVIAATITDQRTGESLSTESVTFFVRQPSELSPQHQKP